MFKWLLSLLGFSSNGNGHGRVRALRECTEPAGPVTRGNVERVSQKLRRDMIMIAATLDDVCDAPKGPAAALGEWTGETDVLPPEIAKDKLN